MILAILMLITMQAVKLSEVVATNEKSFNNNKTNHKMSMMTIRVTVISITIKTIQITLLLTILIIKTAVRFKTKW